MLAEVDEPDLGEAGGDRFGHHDLPTVGGRHHPGRFVQRQPVPTLAAALRVAEVDPHPRLDAFG